MKIDVDGQELFEIDERDMAVLRYVLLEDSLDADLKRRLKWVIEHKIERCYVHFKEEWMPKLEADSEVSSVPVNVKDLFDMVRVRPDYKERAARAAEEELEVVPS